MGESTASKPTIVAVQALRALAALAVAAVHFEQVGLWLQGDHRTPLALNSLAAGVDLFFAISGFVMVYSSDAFYGRPDAPRMFIVSRLARIVPLYWVATLVAIPLMDLPFTWGRLAGSLLFVPFPNAEGQIVPLLGVGWTLDFEMFFYMLFALALFAPRRWLVPGMSATLAAVVMLGAMGLGGPVWWRFVSDPIVLEFVFGMLIALAYRRGAALPVWLRLALIAGGAAAVWFSLELMPPSGLRAVRWGLPTAAILAGAVLGPPPPTGRLRAVVVTLGDASYSLYLLHGLCSAVLFRAWPSPLVHQVAVPTAMISTYLATILLSVAAHRFLEQPATSAIRCLLLGPRRAVPQLPAAPAR